MPSKASQESEITVVDHQAAANLSALLESTEDLIWSVDLEFRLLTFNSALRHHVERNWGTRAAVGKRPQDLLPPERAAIWPPLFQRALSQGPFRAEMPFPGNRIVEMYFHPIRVDGHATGISMFGRDVTENRLAEKELRESEESLRESQRIGALGSYVLDIPAGVWIGSEVLDELFGIDREYSHSVDSWLELIHPDDRTMMADYFTSEVLGKGKAFDREYRIIRANDKQERWLHGMGTLEFDSENRPVRMRGIIKDVTLRKQADLLLAGSEERYRATFEQAAVGISRSSFDGKLLSSNACFAEFLGYPVAEMSGLSVDQITAPEDRPSNLVARQRVLTSPAPTATWEKRFIRKDGSLTWAKVTISIQRDSDGRALNFIALIEDINALKAAQERLTAVQQALQTSEERYRTAFQTSIDAININRLDDGTYVECNNAFLDIIGFSRDEVIGRTSLQLGIWADPRDRQKMAELVRDHGSCRDLEAQFRKKNGETFWGLMSASPIELGGVPCVLSVTRDISAAKAAEHRLAAAAEALRLSEHYYRTLFQTSVDGICVSQLEDGRMIDANKAFLDLMGFEREEVIGRTSLELSIWVEPAARLQMAAQLREHSSVRDFTVHYARKNGEPIWLLASASIIEIQGVLCAITVLRDLSAARAAEESLATARQAQEASEVRYRLAFDTSVDCVVITRESDAMYLEVNQAFLDIVGYRREEVLGRSALELNIWANPEDRRRWVEILRRDSSCRSFETQFRRKNGELYWGQMSASVLEVDGVRCILSITRDISAAKAAAELLTAAAEAVRVSEERYRKVFQTSLDPITISRLDAEQYLDVNQAFLDLTGFKRDEVIGKSSLQLNIWADPRDQEYMLKILERSKECRNLEFQFLKKSGETIWALMSASLLEIDGVPCVLSVARDISNAKAAEDEIHNLAFYDPLTGLPNRRMLIERLHQALAASHRSGRLRALLFVDLDNFKTLNDTLGHQIGDLLLQDAARRLAGCVRDTDTVGRLGGDEFVLMLEDLAETPEDAAAQAKVVGEKILATIAQPFLLDGRECRSGASIGIAVFGDQRESTNEVLQQADIAMYQAKAAGRNTLRFFAPALQAAVNARAAMEEDLRQAIQTGQFVLYYQPQIDRNRLAGVEALLRWRHPWRNILGPSEFIPLAEETGLILPLGKWVLEAACKQIAAWAGRKQSAILSVAVNISARQFHQTDFVEQVLSALERTGANPRNLRLELTESILVENVEEVIDKMKELKSHGLKFSLDDFGTGYSSLAYLKRLPLDQMKIDRSFIRDILADESSAAIAQTIISLSRAMGLPVIAEGVETEEQRQFLTRIGCHAFQGYLFSRPVALEEFQRLWLPSVKPPVSIAG
jgi:diguanylate cyclase (GGDEF)-like protein/PAS domain S-box-containing protein